MNFDARDRDHLTARNLIQIHNTDANTGLAFQRPLTRVVEKRNDDFDAQDAWHGDSTPEMFEDVIESQPVGDADRDR